MSYLIEQYEIDVELADYINLHALIIDMQANPIAIFNDSLELLYANTALNNLLHSNDTVATVELFNSLFRGVKQVINASISGCKANTLNKVIKDRVSGQLIPYKLKIIPFTRDKVCLGVYVIVETDINRLVNYFSEEKSDLSKKISELTLKNNNTIKLVSTLFDNSPVGMMIFDKDKRIIQLNKSGAVIFGLELKKAIGMPISRFISDNTQQVINSNNNSSKEINVITWNGEEKILLHCSVESVDENEQVFTVDTFMDVTSIEKARVAAEDSNRAKSEFLANMSHELRTPLHAIMGFSECGLGLGKDLDSDKADDYFNKIHHGGEVLLALVDNLLDVAKLETGKIIFNFENVQFDDLVKDVIKEFDAKTEEKDLKITFAVKNSISSLDMDVMQMQQVVRNLVSNAVKFTAHASEIVITLEQLDDHIQLRIYDNGPGIPTEELENIFDKFIQSSRTNTGAGGTGLGLSICREILNQHNAIIWAENNPDGGAVFIVNQYFEH
jgi:PAS domain S-box-containing protein